MDPHPATARLDEALEGVLLSRVQDIPSGIEEDDRSEASEVPLAEGACIFRRFDGKTILAAELLYGRYPAFDRAVSVAARPGENEDARRLCA